MPVFEASSADRVWLQSISAVKKSSDVPLQNGRGGQTFELLHAMLHVYDSRDRWVTSRDPVISVPFAIVEVIGILNGRRDSGYLNFFNPVLSRYSGNGTEYQGAYGFRLRLNAGFDQLERAANALRANSEGRQVVLQIWDPATDFPTNSGEPAAPDIPCNICSLLKIRQGKLEWSQIMRSNDIFRGLPYNFVQFMTLQEVLAGWIGIEPGSYTHYADSLHLYREDAERSSSSNPLPVIKAFDHLTLPMDQSNSLWREMNRRVDELATRESTEDEYRQLAVISDGPQAYTNLMAVVVADAARRRKNPEMAQEIIMLCDNPVLRLLCQRWFERCRRNPSKRLASE